MEIKKEQYKERQKRRITAPISMLISRVSTINKDGKYTRTSFNQFKKLKSDMKDTRFNIKNNDIRNNVKIMNTNSVSTKAITECCLDQKMKQNKNQFKAMLS